MRPKAHPSSAEHEVSALATRQGGVVSRRQLVALGVGPDAIKYRVGAGRLVPIPGHRAVFMVGHAAKASRTMLWAAHLALGTSSVISHRSAAALWNLRGSAIIELTVPGPSRRRAAMRVHRTTWLPDADVTTIEGLPVTRVARTLLDLGAVVAQRGVERAFDQAMVNGTLDMREIGRVLHDRAARPGAAKLRWVAGRDAAGTTVTDNGLGELMLAIIRRAGLPEPICQHSVLTYTADFCWPHARLIVEADGRSHDTRAGREHDARRDVALQNAGWRVLRFPKRVILSEPAYVADAISRALRG
jgi:hypothetical protein